MRGALIHGILLAVMLVYGYRTWTRDKTVLPNVGNVVLWDKAEADIASIEYKGIRKVVTLARKPEGYWWGTDVTVETKARPRAPEPTNAGSAAGSGSAGSAAGSGSGSAGSGAGSGSAAKKEPEVVTVEEDELSRKAKEFPLGDTADKLIKSYAAARAIRDLGKPSDAAKKDYKLGTKPTNILYAKDGSQVTAPTITIKFKDGSSRTFVIGGNVYASSDKYVMDQQSGKAYVFSKDLLTALEVGESNLHLLDPRGFDAAKIGTVTVESNGRTKSFTRTTTKGGADGAQNVKTWSDPSTGKPDQTAANFIDNANNLRPTEYAANLKASDMTPILKLTFKEERGAQLGTLQLFKREKPGELAPGQELDPANPPKSDTEYYILTEKTRVPALVRKDTAQRMEQDIDTVFSGKGADTKPSIDPKGNPFGPTPPGAIPSGPPGGPNPHGGMPGIEGRMQGMGSPAPAGGMPGMGSATPTGGMPGPGMGSAAPKAPTGGPVPGAGSAAPKAPTGAPAPTGAGSAAPKAPTPAPATTAPKAPAPAGSAAAPKPATPPAPAPAPAAAPAQ